MKGKWIMTANKLIEVLRKLPDDCIIMSNSGWECDETDIGGVWYSEELNEAHLTQGGRYEAEKGYSLHRTGREKAKFKMIYCDKGGNDVTAE